MKMSFKKNSTLIKLITLPVLMAFLSQNIAWTEPLIDPAHPPLAPKIFVPESYGKIEQPSANTQSDKRVILIKDAHCNYEAQTNISHILDILIRDYKIDLVCVEGSSSHVDPSVIAAHCDNPEIRKKVTDKYLKKGLLTAAEALSINRGTEPGFTIWGVEDLKLYMRDYQAFKDTMRINGETSHFVKLLSKTISQLKKKLYPEKLQKFDGEINRYKINEIPLTNFIKFLTLTKPIPTQEYPTLDLVLRSIRLEEKIFFGKVEDERTALIKHLEQHLPKEDLRELVKQSLLFKLGKIPQVDYYTYLEEYFRVYRETLSSPMENLENYFTLVKMQVQIDEKELFRELEKFQENIYTDLMPDERARQLHELDKDVKVLTKVLNLGATREDFNYYKNNRHKFKPEKLISFIKIQAPLNNINLPPELKDPSFLEKVKTAMVPSEQFYNLALGRDQALVENLLRTMTKHKKDTAVLIVGGFHTEGIKKLLIEKEVSPTVITPSITKPQEDSHELYLARIMDERINPEMILAKLSLENLSPVPATDTLFPDDRAISLMVEDLREELRTLLPERFDIRDFLKEYGLDRDTLVAQYNEALEENPALASFLADIIEAYNRTVSASERIALRPLDWRTALGERADADETYEQRIKYILAKLRKAKSPKDAEEFIYELSALAKEREGYIARLAVITLETLILSPRISNDIKYANLIPALTDIIDNAKGETQEAAAKIKERIIASPFVSSPIKNAVIREKILEELHQLQETFFDQTERGETAEAQKTLEKIKQKVTALEEIATEGGMAVQLVFEKLGDILYEMLEEGDIQAVNLACITLPIAAINKLDYKKADRLKAMFYERVKEYVAGKRPDEREERGIRVGYDTMPGKYYGFSKTRLFVLGLTEEDLEDIHGIYKECLDDPDIKSKPKDFPMYAGHVLVDLNDIEKIFTIQLDEIQMMIASGKVEEEINEIITEFIVGNIKEVTGRAQAIENLNQERPQEYGHVLGERDKPLWTIEGKEDKEKRKAEKISALIKEGRKKYIPVNEYDSGKIPRLDHIFRYLMQPEKLEKLLSRQASPEEIRKERDIYLKVLNEAVLDSFLDIRYKKAFKEEYFSTVLSAWKDGTLSRYTEWLKEKGYEDLAEKWNQRLKMAKMTKKGDEIWLYLEMEDETIKHAFGELDKYNASNVTYIADARDSFYHQILDFVFEIHEEINGGEKFTPREAEEFTRRLNEDFLDAPLEVPDDPLYRDGYEPRSVEAKIIWRGEEETICQSRPVLDPEKFPDRKIYSGMKVRLGDLIYHHSTKVYIDGDFRRLFLYEAKKGKKSRHIVIYDNKIYTADEKGDEVDVTEELMTQGWEFSPVIGPTGITITTDFDDLVDDEELSNRNTNQKARGVKIEDAKTNLANQIISALKKHGIEGIEPGPLAQAIGKGVRDARAGRKGIDIIELLKSVERKLEPAEFFVAAAEIAKPLNDTLGREAKTVGGRAVAVVLQEILDQLPEAEGEAEELTDKERLIKRVTALVEKKEKGVHPYVIRHIIEQLIMGLEILALDGKVDFNKIDPNYFELLDQIRWLIDNKIEQKKLEKIIFGKEVALGTRGDPEQTDSPLAQEVKKLKFYRGLLKDRRLFTLDFPEAELENEARDTSYSDAVDKDTDELYRILKHAKIGPNGETFGEIIEGKNPFLISAAAEQFIDWEELMKNIPGDITEISPEEWKVIISYSPGLQAFIKLMEEKVKNPNARIALRVKDPDSEIRKENSYNTRKTLLEGIINAAGLADKVIVDKEFETAADVTGYELEGVEKKDMAFVLTPEQRDRFGDQLEGEIRNNRLKAFVADTNSEFHAILLYGAVCACAGNMFYNNKYSETGKQVIRTLKILGMDAEEVERIITDNIAVFQVKLIRITEKLRELRIQRATIHVAA